MSCARSSPAMQTTTVDIACKCAEFHGTQLIYRFHTGGTADKLPTFVEVDVCARKIAAILQMLACAGDRVICIALSNGPDFAIALFGCIYAGMINIPAYPARPSMPSGARVVLTDDPEKAQSEPLVILQEVDRRHHSNGAKGVFATVLQAVWEAHEVERLAIVLTMRSGISRTSTGKIRRTFCRKQFESDDLPTVALWRKPDPATRSVAQMPALEFVRVRGNVSTKAIRRWLIGTIAQSAGLHSSEIDPCRPNSQFRLDFIRSGQISGELEEATQCRCLQAGNTGTSTQQRSTWQQGSPKKSKSSDK